MRLLRFSPALLFLLVAAGCGVDRKITAPLIDASAASRASALANVGPAEGSDSPRLGGANTGSVFTITNAAEGNAVLVWTRAADGTLSAPSATPTGGNGTGRGLGDQGAIIASATDGLVFAVDAGSNDIAMLRVTPGGLRALGTTPSGGTTPISVTRHGDLLFVLNAGGDGNISGFRIHRGGGLTPIPGSTRALGGTAVGPAQVSFSPDGRHLVVTEKAANAIAVYDVSANGAVSEAHVRPSAGATPFGFAFTRAGTLVVSEAAGGAAGLSSASSYGWTRAGTLAVISGAVPTHQTAACWVAIPRDGDYAYTANAASSTVSGYRVGADGSINLLDADGVTARTDGGALDSAFDASGRFLYVLAGSAHRVSAFQRSADGHLTPIAGAGDLPATSVGLAAI